MVFEMLAEFMYSHPLIGIILFSLFITLSITIITYFLTDKVKMKEIKEKQTALRAEMKKHKDNPEKVLELNKKMMEDLPHQLKSSMKIMLITIIPIFIILAWANANIAYMPIHPNQDFMVTADLAKGTMGYVEIRTSDKIKVIGNKTQQIEDNNASWILNGETGDYILTFLYKNETVTRELIITDGIEYAKPPKTYGENILSIKTNEKKIYLNLFGWRLGWLGTYIIFSIFFSIILRKVFKMQ